MTKGGYLGHYPGMGRLQQRAVSWFVCVHANACTLMYISSEGLKLRMVVHKKRVGRHHKNLQELMIGNTHGK